jgi:LAO/AO transport system kinase
VSAELIELAKAGDTRSIGRLLSLIEDSPSSVPALAASGHARVIGITGAPGVGKSTLTTALIGAYRSLDLQVAVIAVDPTSPFSGGALLGDRIRMQEYALDQKVFIRSMATRGHLGGLAAAVPHVARALDAVGFDVVLIETVGVGQSEVEIAAHADTTLVLLAPGMGDGIQAAKAGLLEIGDIYVINKADREGAEVTAKEIRQAMALGPARQPEDWRQRVLLTSADRGQGIDEVVAALGEHRVWLEESGTLHARRRRRTVMEIEQLALSVLHEKVSDRIDVAADRVESGEMDPYQAARALVDGLPGLG